MGERFSVRISVRSYELDLNGHVNHAVYHRYGEHARSEHLAAAGVSFFRLTECGLGIVLLETRARFLRELRFGDTVEVGSVIAFGTGRTFRIDHPIVREDGVPAAEIEGVFGLIDARERRLVTDPAGRLRSLASDPAVLVGDGA